MDVTLPELTAEAIVLRQDPRTRGLGDGSPAWSENLTGKLRIGGPVAVPVTPAYVASSPDLAAFVAGEAGRYVYQIVHLAVGFEQDSQPPRLESVTIQLRLSSHDCAPPIAWSMIPICVMDTEEVTTAVRLSPQLKLLGVEASAGSAERSNTHERGRVFLEALGELQVDPKWEFRRTRSRELRGSYRLVLVLRCTAGAASSVEVSVCAEGMRGSILRRYRETIRSVVVSTQL